MVFGERVVCFSGGCAYLLTPLLFVVGKDTGSESPRGFHVELRREAGHASAVDPEEI